MCNCNTASTIAGGQPGSNGFNAFTTIAAILNGPFTYGGGPYTVTVTNDITNQYNGKWAVPGQIIFIESLGYCLVVQSTSTTITFGILTGYLTNTLPGSLTVGLKIAPAGLVGPQGLPATAYGRILYNSDVDIATTTTMGEVLHTYNVLANQLVTDGDSLIVRGEFITNDKTTNNTSKYALIEFGGVILHSDYTPTFSTTAIKGFRYTIHITRINNTTTSYKTEFDTLSSVGILVNTFTISDTKITEGNIIGPPLDITMYPLYIRAYSLTAGDVDSRFFNVEYIPKV